MKVKCSNFVLNRVADAGCKHVFGVPGDYVLNFLNSATEHERIEYIQCLNELNASYAAEAYCRLNGFSCLVVTAGVGELSAHNGLGAAMAEQLPMLVIVGNFPSSAYKAKQRYHHMTSSTDLMKCSESTKATVERTLFIESLVNFVDEVDNLITYAINNRCVVSLHIPTDLQEALLSIPTGREHLHGTTGAPRRGMPIAAAPTPSQTNLIGALVDAILEEAAQAKRVLMAIGNQVVVLGIQQLVHEVVDRMGCAVMHTNRLSGVFASDHKNFVNCSRFLCQNYDYIIQLGFELSDMNEERLFQNRRPQVQLSMLGIAVGDWSVKSVYFPQVLLAMRERCANRVAGTLASVPKMSEAAPTQPEAGDTIDESAPIALKALGTWYAQNGSPRDVVIWDLGSAVGDVLQFPSSCERTYIMQEFYATIGWALPATLGVMFGLTTVPNFHKDQTTPIQCWIGDGALLMTAQELLNIHRYAVMTKTPVQIILLDNGGYLVERIIYHNTYNDLPRADYEGLAKFSTCYYKRVCTLKDFKDAVAEVKVGATLIHIVLDAYDFANPEAAQFFGRAIATANGIPLDGPQIPRFVKE
eukprot:Gregarina_sp_Pseudo_9__5792@NODE_86_length_4409_cov_27_601144_g78_i0_p2_GENE_NODE_86_length_4409_cov_27_601144_g78_i0NODE_86_length_4409_cov_27_601144_g78_i0_p2_ORF_typecomplete_len585_score49_17TPP_enzyme_N/PF02776_18/1_3e30TPP_enzyme_C/PF02775_21/5_8e02TPP_enzyme_C/PF02775_21/1_1e19TPP_enzyme_M/PF00205_22/3_5e09TPP_enzyme_M/PF00205_22/6_4e03POR_N/PF01855_19/0_0069POR_N/PF01855_19/2_5e03_NODE_86_length_4409_cov_27_601144_g78_i023454099